jgi:asparagine synthase (glutamine-hydrolysing)
LAGVFLADGAGLDTAGMTAALGFTPSFIRAKATLGHRLHGLLSADYLDESAHHDPFAAMAARHHDALQGLSRVDAATYLWSKSALTNYILRTLGDGCEMPHAVEGRVPFLDHRLWEMARRMPLSLKIRDGVEKHILRAAAKPLLTETLYRRQKHPFIAPPSARLMTPRLRDYISDTLQSASFKSLPFFDPVKVDAFAAAQARADDAAQTANEPVLMTLLTAAALHDRFRMAA